MELGQFVENVAKTIPRQDIPTTEKASEQPGVVDITQRVEESVRKLHSIVKTPDFVLSPQTRLFKLKEKHPVWFDYLTNVLGGMKKKEGMVRALEDNNRPVPANVTTPTSPAYKLFSMEFYDSIKQSGYERFSPNNLAKYFKRLDEIATSEYVEPRDSLSAIKTLLQYNDIDTKQLQEQNKVNTDTAIASEVKNLVSKLKNEYKTKVVDVNAEPRETPGM